MQGPHSRRAGEKIEERKVMQDETRGIGKGPTVKKAWSKNFVFILSREKPLRISRKKGDGPIYILKRFPNSLALSVKIVEFIHLLVVTMGINTRQDRFLTGRPVRKLVL